MTQMISIKSSTCSKTSTSRDWRLCGRQMTESSRLTCSNSPFAPWKTLWINSGHIKARIFIQRHAPYVDTTHISIIRRVHQRQIISALKTVRHRTQGTIQRRQVFSICTSVALPFGRRRVLVAFWTRTLPLSIEGLQLLDPVVLRGRRAQLGQMLMQLADQLHQLGFPDRAGRGARHGGIRGNLAQNHLPLPRGHFCWGWRAAPGSGSI